MKSDFFQTQIFRIIILCLGIAVFSLVVFYAGVITGFRRALYTVNWGENYERNFLGPHGPLVGGAPGGFINDHGTAGEVVSLNANTIIVREDNGLERSILAGTSTAIRLFDQSISLGDLTIGERIVVIGEPGPSGEINAKLIRVFPANVLEATSSN